MNSTPQTEEATYTAFQRSRRIASGDLERVALKAKKSMEARGALVTIFDDRTGEPVDVDFRGTADDVRRRLARRHATPSPPDASGAVPPPAHRGPGRPRLGVVAREVTLLPRHWEWLSAQPGGASVALRKLVEE